MENDKEHKNCRTLNMYVRLCEGKIINKAEEVRRFGVDERSIQRDIDDMYFIVPTLQCPSKLNNLLHLRYV